MSDIFDSSSDHPLKAYLRDMFGEEQAEYMLHMMEEQGIDFASLTGGMSAQEFQQSMNAVNTLMSQSSDPVHWPIVTEVAKHRAYEQGVRQPTAAQAAQARQALSVADLWLDAVTDCEPGKVERAVWSRYDWVDETLPTWKRITEPVVKNLSRAFVEHFSESPHISFHVPGLDMEMSSAIERTMAMMTAQSIGVALGGLAKDSFGSTDVGLPLGSPLVTPLLPDNIAHFAQDLDIPEQEVIQFLAVRECAHHRLFASVPWLTSDLIHAVESYSGEISISLDGIREAVENMDMQSFMTSDSLLSSRLFEAEPTERQAAALERLETLLALVEGWVEVVTRQATAPYLPHHEALAELMRRRRATGAPAEAVLGDLLGLQLRPRHCRGAARLFTLIEADGGRSERDRVWRHPDFIPQARDLEDPEAYMLLRQAVPDTPDEFDADLEKLLDGTLGWAEGIEPEDPDKAS